MRLKELLSENVTLSGRVAVYHYTSKDLGDSIILDPKKSKLNRNSYSNNDYNLSDFPRVFYYTDLKKTEKQVTSAAVALYKGTVNGSSILNVQLALNAYNSNKKGLKATNPNAYKAIYALVKDGGTNWDAFFKSAAKFYDGVFYDRSGSLPIITLFIPLHVTKTKK